MIIFDKYKWKKAARPKLRFDEVFGKVKSGGGHCNVIWADFSSLAHRDKLDASHATVKRHVKKLVDEGFLLSIPFHGRGGKRKLLIAKIPEMTNLEALALGVSTIQSMGGKYLNIADSISTEITIKSGKSNGSKWLNTTHSSYDFHVEQWVKMTHSIGHFDPLLPPCPILELKRELFLGKRSSDLNALNLGCEVPGHQKKRSQNQTQKPHVSKMETTQLALPNTEKPQIWYKLRYWNKYFDIGWTPEQIDKLTEVLKVYWVERIEDHFYRKLKRFKRDGWHTRAQYGAVLKDGRVFWDEFTKTSYNHEHYDLHPHKKHTAKPRVLNAPTLSAPHSRTKKDVVHNPDDYDMRTDAERDAAFEKTLEEQTLRRRKLAREKRWAAHDKAKAEEEDELERVRRQKLGLGNLEALKAVIDEVAPKKERNDEEKVMQNGQGFLLSALNDILGE